MRVLVTYVLTAVALLLATACGAKSGGTAVPVASARDATSLPRAGAPKVSNPLKTSALESDACAAATEPQVRSTGVTLKTAEPQVIAGGKGCLWIFTEASGTVTGNLNVSEPDGLSHLYALKAQGSGLTTFEPVGEISGYPGVIYANGGEGAGVCNLAIGVRDDLMYVLTTQLFKGNPQYEAPCDLLGQFAAFAIQHLKVAQ
ncbi:DUF3558 domain-containing protein [Amycolatopsis keratiniphila]|uniref:DUF3558 domain-containing protein n=1 Tax=Amycolatopsis keratiniphila TaxID=129921 RepID=UPI0009DEACB0|nr:DUF3558 domain-containing protein [Amycolatopsis keratiniphila]